ncbi:MAG: hypothetical protein HQ511_10075 [Rhodospirillales bacterium]|nr:hypothetical protein [Rhodospirillales bacterium]
MADLNAAGKMFDDAIARLEQALNTWSETSAQNAADWQQERQKLESELNSLKDDHARVVKAHKELQNKYETLKRVTNTVSAQLDATVGELAEMLES